jgi:putative cell wall-binding protein
MKKSVKVYSAFIATLMLSSVPIVPAVKAETLQQKQILSQVHHQLEASSFIKQEVAAQTAVTQAAYQTSILPYYDHEYVFKTTGGDFNVTALHPVTDGLDFLICDADNMEVIDPLSSGSFTLPAGTYVFMVENNSDQPVNYEYGVSGPFSEQPDQTVPYFRVENPSEIDILQPGNIANNDKITFEGNTNADQMITSTMSDEITVNAPSTGFSQTVPLHNGKNYITLTARNNSGNASSISYRVTLYGAVRLQGKDRYEVSSNISKELSSIGGSTSRTVIIARGDVFADALSGGPLAHSEDAPILLTTTKALPETVKEQIKQLKPERAIILGGTGSISTDVETELKGLGVTTIDRIGGKDRFDVAASVGERVSDNMGSDTAIIASGEVFPDALSASSLAGPAGMPILLVKSGEMSDSIQAFIKNHPEIENFIVVGGPATVKDTVISKIKSLHSGAKVERISGKDRYEVSINVAKYGIDYYGMDLSTVAVARGDLFPDALSGAPLSAYMTAPILLTTTNHLEPNVEAFLSSHSEETKNIYVFGGPGSVSEYTFSQLFNLIY